MQTCNKQTNKNPIKFWVEQQQHGIIPFTQAYSGHILEVSE